MSMPDFAKFGQEGQNSQGDKINSDFLHGYLLASHLPSQMIQSVQRQQINILMTAVRKP